MTKYLNFSFYRPSRPSQATAGFLVSQAYKHQYKILSATQMLRIFHLIFQSFCISVTTTLHCVCYLGGVDDAPEEGLAGVATHPAVVEVRHGAVPADRAGDHRPRRALLHPPHTLSPYSSVLPYAGI